jgi:hydroxylamine dehydrogenase
MKRPLFLLWILLLVPGTSSSAEAPLSKATQSCVACHSSVTPGIVADWEKSRHSTTTVSEALKKRTLERRISVKSAPQGLGDIVVGCAECHTLAPGEHTDTFDHNGFKIHVLVSPSDCATCHPVEREQYDSNLMSNAHANLKENSLYMSLVNSVDGTKTFKDGGFLTGLPDERTYSESCFYCHGTKVVVKEIATRETAMGAMKFPVLEGWPNQGVGRVNPDGTRGSCTPCHTRHRFSIEMARAPYTCSECHKGPDVPAFGVYMVSKHGNIYSSECKSWDMEKVPWTVGRDFSAPTCAACHVSLLATQDGVTAERSHRMNDRSAWRIFGLIYAHPSPKSPNTTSIRNKAGLPLPTGLTGEPAPDFVIDAKEQDRRRERMKSVCAPCHSRGWVDEHYARLENTIRTTNDQTLAATAVLLDAWQQSAAEGPGQGADIFDEAIEKMWVEQWLFFANSTRFSSAMAGADYGAFANGRWYMSKNLEEMKDLLELKLETMKKN